MSGSTYGLDDGGAIPDDQSDSYDPSTSENSDQASQAQPQEQASAQLPDESFPQAERGSWTGLTQETPGQFAGDIATGAKQQIGQGIQNLKNDPMVKRIIGYLSGGDAAAPAVAQKFEAGVKTEHPGISDDDANLLAVHKAGEMGGPAAAWAMVQYNRMAYNAKQSFAKAALNGVDGKAGDMQAAAQAATQASAHILDGSQAVFTAQPQGGVTATVKMPGTNQRASYNLTPQQFDQWLDVGHAGQWDKVMEQGGTPTALARIAAARPQAVTQPGGQENADKGTQAPQQDTRPEAVRAGHAIARDVTDADQPALPGTHDANGHYIGPKDNSADTQFDPYLEARADQMFGKGNVNNPDRVKWMAEQENQEEERQAKKDIAQTNANARITVGNTNAGAKVQSAGLYANARQEYGRLISQGRVQQAQVRAQQYADAMRQKANIAFQQMEMRAQDQQTRNRIMAVKMKIMDPSALMRKSPDEVNNYFRQAGLGGLIDEGGGSAPPTQQTASQTPAAAAQPSPAPQQAAQPVPAANQRVRGQVYTTPKGQFRWMGNGWQAVQ